VPSRKAERSVLAAARLREAGRSVAVPSAISRQTLLSPELAGSSLRELLLGGGSLPSPERLARVVRDIAGTAPGRVTWTRPEPGTVAGGTARLLETLVPDLTPEVHRVRRAAEAGASTHAHLVHGDLYEAQVVVGRGYSLGLIDLDDVALGDPAMDAANVSAHLLVLALAVPAAAGRLVAYRELARFAFQQRLGIPSSELAWREALCVLQLATGPFRVLDPRWPAEVRRRVRLAVRLLG
jgi:aminoglycoside phosphotransferase (APT) family kinase protein